MGDKKGSKRSTSVQHRLSNVATASMTRVLWRGRESCRAVNWFNNSQAQSRKVHPTHSVPPSFQPLGRGPLRSCFCGESRQKHRRGYSAHDFLRESGTGCDAWSGFISPVWASRCPCARATSSRRIARTALDNSQSRRWRLPAGPHRRATIEPRLCPDASLAVTQTPVSSSETTREVSGCHLSNFLTVISRLAVVTTRPLLVS